uniref:Neuronal pentraxin IIb n=1 Tax=Eptatretus burgeri TaxID=7764 RepID=A0A8C4QB26_EPTBU
MQRAFALAEATRLGLLCSAVPPGEDPVCNAPSPHGTFTHDTTVIRLRETVLLQKETILSQRDTIHELRSELGRCEVVRDKARQETGNAMEDRPPNRSAEILDELGRTMRLLKHRLESLEHDLENSAGEGLSRHGKTGIERHLLTRVIELEHGKSQLQNETMTHQKHVDSALTVLQQRVDELEHGTNLFKTADSFKASFLLRTDYMYARVQTRLPEMYAFTVSMWLRSSATPGVGTPFSYAVPGEANELALVEWGGNPMELLINDKVAQMPLTVNDGRWHHLAITWTTRDGMWSAYQDGQARGSGEDLAAWHPIKPGGMLILGQEQDHIGGQFDAIQAFVGELADFQLWDRVLPHSDLISIANCSTTLSGNVVAWATATIELRGGAVQWPLESCAVRRRP